MQFRPILAVLVLWTLAFERASAEEDVAVDRQSVVAYVNACLKPNGAFGPSDQAYTDAAWNYPALHTLRLLGAELPDRDALLEHGLGYPAGHAGVGHWLVFHQSMIRWLVGKSAELEPAQENSTASVTLEHQGHTVRYYGSPFGTAGEVHFNASGSDSLRRFQDARKLGFYNLASLNYTLSAVRAAGRKIENPQLAIDYVLARQAPCGGFVDVRTSDGVPTDADAHLASTFHAVACLHLLQAAVPRKLDIAGFVAGCQQHVASAASSWAGVGGYGFHPDASRAGNIADIYYTYCGLQTLSLIGADISHRAECVEWINGLQNHDGGFGDRPAWRSRLYSTYYAVHALRLLEQRAPTNNLPPLVQLAGLHLAAQPIIGIGRKKRSAPKVEEIVNERFQIFQGLFKTPVVVAKDLVPLRQRGLNLLAMKTEDFSQADPLVQAIAREQLPMGVILCPEAYPHRLKGAGGALLNHVGNFTLDPAWNPQQRKVWNEANLAGAQGLTWDGYRQQVLAPLQALGCLCYPEQDFEMEHAYATYDAGVYQQHGYNAIQAGFNWSPRDFVRVFPWRERYTDKLPAVADADAHGDLAKWSPQLDHVRHLYLAERPDYASFLDAANNGRVVCVAVPGEGDPSDVSIYGSPAAVRFVRQRINDWQWWPKEGK